MHQAIQEGRISLGSIHRTSRPSASTPRPQNWGRTNSSASFRAMLSSPVASCALGIALEWSFLALVLMACRPTCCHCPSRFATRHKAGSVQRSMCYVWLCFLTSPYETLRTLRFAEISLQNSWREPRVDVAMMSDIRQSSRSVRALSALQLACLIMPTASGTCLQTEFRA